MLGVTPLLPGAYFLTRVSNLFLPAKDKLICKAVTFIFFIIMLEIPSWIGDENSIMLFPFFMVAFVLCRTGRMYARLIVGGIFFSLAVPFSMVLDTAFPDLSLGNIWGFQLEFTILYLIKSTLFGLIFLAAKKFVPVKIRPLQSRRLWALMGVLSLAPLFTTLIFSFWNRNWFFSDGYGLDENVFYQLYSSVLHPLAYSVLPFASLSSAGLLTALAVLSRHEELEEMRRLSEIQSAYYQGVSREQTALRTLRHDLNNHITAALGLLANDNLSVAVRAANDYLRELANSPAITGSRRVCENETANAVLTVKSALMEREGISAEWEVSLPKKMTVADTDLCALLGNAIDNAVEAVRKVGDNRAGEPVRMVDGNRATETVNGNRAGEPGRKVGGNRATETVNGNRAGELDMGLLPPEIKIRIRSDKGGLMLYIENPCGDNHCAGAAGRRFATTKPDASKHGFGLRSIEEIAKRYGGRLEAESRDGKFTLTVFLPGE